MQKKDILSSDVKPAGEGMVWITSMGLALGLTMIVFLLGMIVYNGLEVFWPKPVVQLELKEGSTAGLSNAPVFAGQIVKSQDKAVQKQAKSGAPATPHQEYQLFVGNKDVYGFGYKFIDHSEILAQTRPTDVVVAERLEYGNAIFVSRELQLADGTVLAADSPKFDETLHALIKESNQRRSEIREIERDEIGEINIELEKIRLAKRAIDAKGGELSEKDRAQLAQAEVRKGELQIEYEQLASQARKLRDLQHVNKLVYTTIDGAERSMATGDLIGFLR